VRAFEERRTLTGSLSHREHVMIAWHHARTRPAQQALAELARVIQELAVALGWRDALQGCSRPEIRKIRMPGLRAAGGG
jgi:hypothetical protein